MFLAISGALTIGLMGGIGASINSQRYKDAVNTHVSDFRDEYSSVTNVANDRAGEYSCTPSGGVVRSSGPLTNMERGTHQSCAIVGRLLISNGDGSGFVSQPVFATREVRRETFTGGDLQALQAADLVVETTEGDKMAINERNLQWQATYAQVDSSRVFTNFAVLIVRSPLSGSVRTFVHNGQAPSNRTAFIRNQLLSDASAQQLIVCINGGGLVGDGVRTGVTIARNAGGSGGVDFASEDICR